MKVIASLADSDLNKPSVLSIGNFDGLHLGHQAILKKVVRRAGELNARSAAMTFWPHPIRILAPERAPRLISTLEQRIRLIAAAGIDVLFVAPFDEAFSRLSPEEFIQRYVIDGLHARSVCVGLNFSFGHRQRGSLETLRKRQSDFEVIAVPPVRQRGAMVSSSRVRELLAQGRVSSACRMLGRWVEIEGSIVSGAGRGRIVTVPTINVSPDNEIIPSIGVYVSQISLDDAPFLDAITNIGVRPTFGESDVVVETFVLDQRVPNQADRARLKFLRRLRNEIKFDSPEALRRQIGLDVERCRKFFRLLRGLNHAGHYSS